MKRLQVTPATRQEPTSKRNRARATAIASDAVALRDSPPATAVQVIYGASVQSFPLAGLQVSHARDVLTPILGVDAAAQVLVNGRPSRAGSVLTAGDTLELVHHAGEKG